MNLFKLEDNYFTMLWWFLPYINMNWPCVPPSWSLLPPSCHRILLHCPRAPALGALFHAGNLLWSSVLHIVMHVFQCYSLRSSHPRLLPLSPKVCSLRLCLLCCPACRIIVTNFLNSIYICWYAVFVFLFLTYITSIIGSRFIRLIRTDSNVFLFIAE